MNRLQTLGLGSRPGLLMIIAGVVFLLGVSQSSTARGYYGGVAVAGGYRPPVYGGGTVAVAGPRGVAVAGPNGAVAVQRSYAPCYPYGYVRVIPTGYTTVYYSGYNCYFVSGVYYRPEFYGGSTVYVVVNP